MAKKEKDEEISLDAALDSSKKTKTTLQGLLKRVSEGAGYYRRKTEEEEKMTPQLSYEAKSRIVEEILLEEGSSAERKTPVKAQPSFLEKTTSSFISQPEDIAAAESLAQSVPQEAPIMPTPSISIPPPPPGPPRALPKIAKAPAEENVYGKLSKFFEELINGYTERYSQWENSISNILGILRKMRQITKKNTEDLVGSITNVFEKIQHDLTQFKSKRDEIEKVAGIDIQSMSGEFKKVLGLLELQIKEYQLKRVTDDYIRNQSFYM